MWMKYDIRDACKKGNVLLYFFSTFSARPLIIALILGDGFLPLSNTSSSPFASTISQWREQQRASFIPFVLCCLSSSHFIQQPLSHNTSDWFAQDLSSIWNFRPFKEKQKSMVTTSQGFVYGTSIAITLGIQLSGFIVAYALQTETFYDILGVSFVLSTLSSSATFLQHSSHLADTWHNA